MKQTDLHKIYEQYGKKSPGSLSPDEQHALIIELDSVTEIREQADAQKFLHLLALLREAEAMSISGLGNEAMATITGAFSGGDEGVYAADTDLMNARFIFELVQNVDDCQYNDVNNCTLKIQFNIASNAIRLEYNELGFQPENVIAITGLGCSTKNHKKAKNFRTEKEIDQSDLQEIGEKGIGFKSVFGLAKQVKITSRYFCFTINRDSFFVPVVDDYKNFTYTDGTILELTLDDGMVEELYSYLQEKYDNVEAVINENPILFLNKLTEIKYYRSAADYFGFRVSRSEQTGEYFEEETIIEYFSSDPSRNRRIDAYRFSHNIEYSIQECLSRYGDQEDSTRKHKIIIIAPQNPETIKKGRIYSFFATSEVINAPFIIHAPFRLNSGRTKIDSQSQGVISKNLWFMRTQSETVKMIHYVYERLAKYQGNNIRYYIPNYSLVNTGCAMDARKLQKDIILSWKIFEDVDSNYHPANDVCMLAFSGTLDQLIEIHQLLGVKKCLLKINSSQASLFRNFNIEQVGNIGNKLLRCALDDEEKTADCLKYLDNYEPSDPLRMNIKKQVILSYRQLNELSRYRKITEWLNQHTFDYLKPEKRGVKLISICSIPPRNISVIQDFCDDYGDSISSRFVNYLKDLNYYDTNFPNTIYLSNAIFGKNMLEDFAEAYRRIEPKDKFFYPFLKIEAVSEEIDRLCKRGSDISDYEFLSKLKVHRTNQKNMLKSQYQSILDLIEKSGTETGRFFPELLQNIDDLTYDAEPHAVFTITRSEESFKLCVEYNEIGFSREQIRAITAIGDSTKRKLLSSNTTGEKGIGFKSIFALCSCVDIESGCFSFRLYAERPTIPEDINRIEHHDGTRMLFTLKPREAQSVVSLLADEQQVIKNILCLKQLHRIDINSHSINIIDKQNRRVIKYGNHTHEYFLYIHPIEIHNSPALLHRQKTKAVQTSQKIEYLVPLNNPNADYCVYSTFPTQEGINIPMIINMPLELDTARERIRDGEWNREIIRWMMNGLLDVYEKLKHLKKENLSDYFPVYGRVLVHKFGHSQTILSEIASRKLFKLALKNDFTTLNNGLFSRDFEYMLFQKYKPQIAGDLQNRLLAKSQSNYDRLVQLYDTSRIKERTIDDICLVIDTLIHRTDNKGKKTIEDKSFRTALYQFLSDFSDCTDSCTTIIKKWKIIPIRFKKQVKFEAFSEEIYAPGDDNIDSEKYKILDEHILSINIFNKIYQNITGQYKPLQPFSKDVIIAEFFAEIVAIFKDNTEKDIANKILSLYLAERNLFEETYKSRKDFPTEKLYFVTRTDDVCRKNECFICSDSKSQGCLDKIIVSSEYENLAKLVGIEPIGNISSYTQISFVIGRSELAELNINPNLTHKEDLFSSLYSFRGRSPSLQDGIGFFELFSVTPEKVRLHHAQDSRTITLTEEILQKYSNEINKISLADVPITFVVDFELSEFEKDNIINEIEDELQVRKESVKLNKIMGMLSNCFYCSLLKREPCCIRVKNKNLFLIDTKIIADYDIIEVLKAYFLKFFGTEFAVNRNIRLYSRYGFENISTIESDDTAVSCAVAMMSDINLTNIEDTKDFVCKPLLINGVTYGGYAKTCPLCGVRVDTELTGMRIYKTKSNGLIIPFLSCCNCHENLRYSSSIDVDIEKVKNGILEFDCQINGFEWKVREKTIRLGHRALIRKINQKH